MPGRKGQPVKEPESKCLSRRTKEKGQKSSPEKCESEWDRPMFLILSFPHFFTLFSSQNRFLLAWNKITATKNE